MVLDSDVTVFTTGDDEICATTDGTDTVAVEVLHTVKAGFVQVKDFDVALVCPDG